MSNCEIVDANTEHTLFDLSLGERAGRWELTPIEGSHGADEARHADDCDEWLARRVDPPEPVVEIRVVSPENLAAKLGCGLIPFPPPSWLHLNHV